MNDMTKDMTSPILRAQQILWDEMTAKSAAIRAFAVGAMGLTPDSVKATPEWQKAKREYDTAANALRAFNRANAKAIKAARTAS